MYIFLHFLLFLHPLLVTFFLLLTVFGRTELPGWTWLEVGGKRSGGMARGLGEEETGSEAWRTVGVGLASSVVSALEDVEMGTLKNQPSYVPADA